MKRNLSNINFTPISSSSQRRRSLESQEIPLAESTAIATDHPDVFRGRKKIGSPLSNQRNQRIKIDKRILTDAQSSGIVSRLVKYYDESQNEVAASERNRIVYNKVGDFPLVHLKKTVYKRSINKTTNVRIAPPNRTVLNRDMRAAIMRSNSFPYKSGVPKLQPVKMRAKDDSHQIITNHEPILDEGSGFSASSKSVLDALEKNCRKRINNEELILESSKKFCLPPVAVPVPVSVSVVEEAPQANVTPPSAKRSRERTSPNKTNATLDERHRHLKKLKTRNNAVLSSLSSSHHELISQTPPSTPKLNETIALPKPFFNPPSLAVEVVEKIEVDAASVVSDTDSEVPKKLHLFNRQPDPNAKLNRAKFRLYDTDDEDEMPIKFVKPREQNVEFLEDETKVENAKLKRMLAGLTKGTPTPFKKINSKDQVDTPVASISFSTSTTSSSTSPILSTITSTSSTASENLLVPTIVSSAVEGLTGILKTSKTTAESLQTPQKTTIAGEQEKKDTPGGFQFSTSANTTPTKAHVTFGNLPTLSSLKESEKTQLSTIVASTSTGTPVLQAMPSIGGFQFGANKPETTISSLVAISSIGTSSPAVVPSIISKPLSPLALYSSPVVSTSSAPKTSSEITTTASGIGFSFNNKPFTTSAVFGSAPVTSTSVSSGFSMSSILPQISAQIPVAPVGVTQSLSTPSFNFGAAPTKPASQMFGSIPSSTIVASEKSDKPSFAFGASNIAAIKPTQSFGGISSSTPLVEAPKPSFNFGNAPSANTFAIKSTAPPSFGSNTISSSTTSAFGPPSYSSSSFTGITPNKTAPPGTFAFNSNPTPIPNLTATVTPSPSSVFGGFNTTPSAVFGSNVVPSKTTSSSIFSKNNTPVFGSSTATPAEAPKSSFSFGNSALSPPAQASSGQSIFGGSQQSAKPSFNFGSNTATVAPTQSFSGLNTAPANQDASKSAFNFASNAPAPPSFGSSSAPAFGSNDPQKASFHFNNPSQQQQQSLFQFPGNQQQASPFGDNKSNLNFGGGNQAIITPPSPAAASGLFNIGTAGQQQQRKPFRTASRRMK